MAEPFELTVADAASQIRQGRLSPVELMESHLARTNSLEPRLKVWVTLDQDSALAAARHSQKALTLGPPRGPLHGLPVGVKDIYYTEGVKTTGGSPIYADFVPTYDATPVALLKQAGAIIMGKTVTTEFACMDPPPTRNPWDPAHTPGGSSSGSAVGVAARMFPAAMGSQTAGSVVRPASYNGVVGIKPTFGRISRYGVMPVAWSLDTMGVFTRNVEDTAIILGVLARHDPKDPVSSHAEAADFSAALGAPREPPSIGLVSNMMEGRTSPEVSQHTVDVIGQLAEAGASVEEVSVPVDLEDLLAAHRVIMSAEAATVHESDFRTRPDDYGPKVRVLIEEGFLTPAVTYIQAQRVRRLFLTHMKEVVRGFDVLIGPTTPSPAPRDLNTTGDPAYQTPWTACGFPALTLPSGLSASGLPLGIQLASPPLAEQQLLVAAQWCEQVLDFTETPPLAA